MIWAVGIFSFAVGVIFGFFLALFAGLWVMGEDQKKTFEAKTILEGMSNPHGTADFYKPHAGLWRAEYESFKLSE